MIAAYYKFIVLSDELKALHKIRSKDRLDCVAYANPMHRGLSEFESPKGQLFIYKTACRDYINTSSKRIAEWSMVLNGLNFSSIYIEDVDCPEIGYGYPNSNRLLSNGKPNPFFPYRSDGYIFIVNDDFTQIEVYIIANGRNLISSYYQKMIDGGFDAEILEIKAKAKQYFNYEGLFL